MACSKHKIFQIIYTDWYWTVLGFFCADLFTQEKNLSMRLRLKWDERFCMLGTCNNVFEIKINSVQPSRASTCRRVLYS